MDEKFVVFNPGPSAVSFTLYPVPDLPDEMSRHKKRRILRSSAVPVNIPRQSSLDLVKHSGMSVRELESQHELLQMLGGGIPKLYRKEESKETPKKAKKKAETDLEKEPTPTTDLPEDDENPKNTKKTRKTRKK